MLQKVIKTTRTDFLFVDREKKPRINGNLTMVITLKDQGNW